jgi:serine/threonine-protein kinase
MAIPAASVSATAARAAAAPPERAAIAPPGPTAGTPFRVALPPAPAIRTSGELEAQLRRRLRVYWALWGAVLLALAATSLVSDWAEFGAEPRRLVTQPPLPGVLLVVAGLSLGIVTVLAPGRRLGLARLRAIEWLAIAVAATLFVVNQSRDLADSVPDVTRTPMTFGTALGAAWGYLIVGFAVLVPSSWWHVVLRTAVLTGCAFLPELLVLGPAPGPIPGLAVFLALKLIMIAVMGALATYGAYRVEALRQDARAARQLGQYVLTRRLSEGGMGEVHLAEHQLLRRPCAVKLIRREHAGDAAALARFEREVRATAQLTHPNTVQIFDYGHGDDGTFYYAMEYLPGVSLDELVARHGALPPARAVHVLAQLCGALREAHGRGLVHRDIKPSNVMLCERGGVPDVAKLLDFGLVTTTRAAGADPKLTQAGVVLGTPAFMSPEQCAGDEIVDAASDIYSLGALAYFLLTGEAPFGGRSAPHVLAAHLYEIPASVCAGCPDVPPALAAAVARCLEKLPARRYPDVVALRRDLLRAVAAAPWTERDAASWWQRHATPA